MNDLIIFLLGIIVGIIISVLLYLLKRKDSKEIAKELITQAEKQKVEDLEALIARIKESFGALSLDALSQNTAEFLKLANQTLTMQTQKGEMDLEGKKKLIDQTLEAIKSELSKIQVQVTGFEKERAEKYGQISDQLRSTTQQTIRLQETTSQLRETLANTKVRGQWGERMAEDVLRLAGFVEGVNYLKQKTMDTTSSRPDYTFLLPQGLKVNMDVKFPLDNYCHYVEVENDSEKENYRNKFLKDVRNRIKEVTSRDYINPEENTVDYVIVFIPNEQVYAFINENDRSILDEALKIKVILCSPLTLYAILAVIRQAIDNFNLEKTAAQILSLFGAFNKQWNNFITSFDKMGRKIDDAQEEFQHLTTTRRNQLEKPLKQIEDLREQKGILVETFEVAKIEENTNTEKV